MPDVSPSEIDRHNQHALEELCRLLRFSQGEFELILAVCNSSQQRQALVEQLRQQCSVSFAEITLEPSTTTLFTTIRSAIGSPPPDALMVYGLDGVHDLQHLLTATNQIREEFRQFPFPLVLWLTDDGLKQLIRTAPDFYTWANAVTFATPPEFFLAFLDQLIADVWQQVVESRENRFLSNQELGLTPGSARCRELETSLEVLAAQGMALTPEQSAGLAFVQGRIADNNTPEAREHYEDSLARWQSLVDQNPGAEAVAQWQEKVGHGQFYLGLWWRNYSVRHRREFEPACHQACRYFEQTVQTFERAQRPDLAARYINYWAEALHRLEDWPALETIATQALQLHQAQTDPIRQARAEGFLAEVDLANENYAAAQRHTEAALALIQPLADSHAAASAVDRDFYAWVNSFHRSWYVFSLGKAQMGQGQVDAAVQTLEQVPTITQPEYDPELYSQTLEYLRRGYFEQGYYLQAFETRREKEAIESRFNFRAFVGAGRLQPKQQITNPALPTGDHGPDLIMASGRRQDVQCLVARLAQEQFKLTIVYGPSGVGKSSLIEAGLVPTLDQQRFGGRRVVPVRLRSYSNWAEDLLHSLPSWEGLVVGQTFDAESVIDTEDSPTPPSEHPSQEGMVLDRLRQQTQRNRVMVLIFDQFEEFFFACEKPADRLRFYSFLSTCLSTTFVKVMLSLREDYTHYLLECNRLTDLAIIDNNILDKKWLYYIGNFSPTDARGVINDLTQPTPYAPAADLVERVVADLGAEAGEVRPIELQIVGSQLQAKGIETLADYQGWPHTESSIKAALVQQYLNDVVQDCGPVAHQQLANLVLYLLTDDKGIRPRKTKSALTHDLQTYTNPTEHGEYTFVLVLEILTKSGLVMHLPEAPEEHYQLVHDYLAEFIRSYQQPLMAQLTQERQKRKAAEQQRSEEQKKREAAEQKQLRRTRLAALGLGALAAISTGVGIFAWVQQRKALIAEVNTQVLAESLAMEAYLKGGLEEAAVTQAMLTGQALQSNRGNLLTQDTQFRAISSIRAVVYGVKEDASLIGHNAEVLSVVFSPDGKMLATASNDRMVKLWSLQGDELKTLRGHTAPVKSVTFSSDGQTLATASDDKTVKLWNLQGDELKTLKNHNGKVLSAVFSPDGKTLATASDDKTIKLWNLQGDELKTLKGHTAPVRSVAFSPDGKTLATASDDKTIRLWNLQGDELKTLKGYTTLISSVTFSPDGKMLAVSSDDKAVQLLNLQGDKLKTLNGHGSGIKSVAFSPDGQTLATASMDNTVKLWDKLGKELLTLKGHSAPVNSVSFSPDGKMLTTASDDQAVKIWNWKNESQKILTGHSLPVRSVSFSPDGQTLATASEDHKVKLWDKLGKELLTLNGHDAPINSVAFSRDGEMIATASDDSTVKLWSDQGKELRTLKGHDGAVKNVAFSPDGSLVVTAGYDRQIRLWNLNGDELETLTGFTSVVTSAVFSPDQVILAAASWDKSVRFFVSHSVDLSDSRIAQAIFPGAAVNSLAFSPDGIFLATAGWDNRVKLWNRQGEEISIFEGHSGPVYEIDFRPDGQILATASGDNTVRLWNLQGEELQALEGHSAAVNSLAFSPDGETLATASSDSTVKLWNFQLEDLIIKGCNWLDSYFIKQSPELLMDLDACQENDPSLLVSAAPLLLIKGEELAREGNSKQAIKFLKEAATWDESLELDPKVRVKSLIKAQALFSEARELARTDQSANKRIEAKLSEAYQLINQGKALSQPVPNVDVKELQRLLVQTGYLPPNFVVTGVYDVTTQIAVLEFQAANNLPDTGIVSDITLNALFRAAAFASSQPQPSNDVKELQRLLIQTGFLPSNFVIAGIYDVTTQTAVREFQQVNNLPTTGTVDAVTWNALYRSTTASIGNRQMRVVTDGDATSVFSGPGTEFDFLRAVPNNSIVTITGRSSGNWSELLDGGWIFSLWLEPI